MGRITTTILTILIIVTGVFTLPTCIKWLSDKSALNGTMQNAEYIAHENDKSDYLITYDLDGGTVEVNNPDAYNLFTQTFTLNNPKKEGYIFTGWTGSNGETPKENVTICTGSSGDLHFKANYRGSIMFSVGHGEAGDCLNVISAKQIDFTIYINNIECVTGSTEYNIVFKAYTNAINLKPNLVQYLKPFENNEIYLKYGNYTTEVVNYYYNDDTAFENLTLELSFSRTATSRIITIPGDKVCYVLNNDGTTTGSYVSNGYYIDGLSTYQHLLHYINPVNTKAKLIFSDLVNVIDSNYIKGETEKTISVSGMVFEYTHLSGERAINSYTAKNTNIKVTYGYMYEAPTVEENSDITLNDTMAFKRFNVDFCGFADGPYFVVDLRLVDADGNEWWIYHYKNPDGSDKELRIQKFGDQDLDVSPLFPIFNSYLNDVKFKVNDDYYFKISNLYVLTNGIYNQARDDRDAWEIANGNSMTVNYNLWTYNDVIYTYDISQFFTLYDAKTDTEVTTNYTFNVDCLTYKSI